jgi:hypothetical protein
MTFWDFVHWVGVPFGILWNTYFAGYWMGEGRNPWLRFLVPFHVTVALMNCVAMGIHLVVVLR